MRSYLLAVLAFLPLFALAQSCCSGGVPLSSNLGLPPSEGRSLQFTLSYDLNILETLKSGTEVLEDDSRSRRTHSVLLEAGYNFNERLSVEGFLSFVRQEREINQFGNRDFDFTQGMGDAVLLAKYRVLQLRNRPGALFFALGAKLPTGASNLKNQQGFTLNADLQPGSGAWDGILWAQWSQSLAFRPSMSLTATTAYSRRGKNQEYLGSQTYQFGDEFQLMAGLSDRLFLAGAILDPSFVLRYRTVAQDQQNSEAVPSTGGHWLFFNPGLTYWFQPNLSFNANVELPLLADITGTQVTPSLRLNAGFYYRIDFNPPNPISP